MPKSPKRLAAVGNTYSDIGSEKDGVEARGRFISDLRSPELIIAK